MAKTGSWGHHTEEAKQKIRAANLGRKRSDETRAKISAGQRRYRKRVKKLLERDEAQRAAA